MRTSQRFGALLIPLMLNACATPAPEIKPVVAARPSDSSKALLDLRGLRGIQAYKNGGPLDNTTALAPGTHTLQFSFVAVRAETYRCPHDLTAIGKEAPPGPAGGLFFLIAGVAVLICPPASRALEKPRACYAISLDAKGGDVYVPRAVGNRPVLVESRSAMTVSTTQSVPCSVVDQMRSKWREARNREIQAREALKKKMDAHGAGWLLGSGYNNNQYRGPDGRTCKDFLSRFFQNRTDRWITSRSTICQDPDGSWSVAKRY